MRNRTKHLVRIAGLGVLAAAVLTACNTTSSDTAKIDSGGASVGRTGSLARFQVVGDQLYALSGTQLQVYGIADPSAITFHNAVQVGAGIETLFARGDHLYIGSQTGMFVYDISDRLLPKKSSEVTHVRACDPVVVEDSTAYVTLRSGGNRCWSANNELQIIDVRDPYQPVKLKTYPMANPHGLGIDGDKLFICDGYAGLKVYTVGIDYSLSLTDLVDGIETYDVIPATGSGQILILIAKDGLYQYDYSRFPMKELSVISIGG
jgi:predicted small secreted protein